MKVSMFHLMPHRDLPRDFEDRYKTAWVDPPWHELAEASQIGQYYRWTLDELMHAARMGLDGICVNEHHQSAYGMMPGPNLMGAYLAKSTQDEGLETAIVQMGSTLPTTQPPLRVAEEYAMLDCISDGRLVAGMPLGSPVDTNMAYGVVPVEQRERYYEAHDLIMRAWQSRVQFAWNGKYTKLAHVNMWPRPVQTPHPPVWIPGTGSLSTWDFAARHNYSYSFLSYFGAEVAKKGMEGFWEFTRSRGLDENPYRAGFLQLVVVGESDEQVAREYGEHVEYFYKKCLHVPPHYMMGPPGHKDYEAFASSVRSEGDVLKNRLEQAQRLKKMSFDEFVERGFVIAGSPATVSERLREAMTDLRVGNLMALLHIGSMPHALTLKNIELFAKDVLPQVSDLWDDEGWTNEWWPERLR